MSYQYRNLTPAEREKIVLHRQARGFPLHAPPHPFRFAGSYLITAATYEHQPIMDCPDRRTEFESALLSAFQIDEVELGGWVILPNHYHFLVGVDNFQIISDVLKSLHGTTSRSWNLADRSTGSRRVWYKFYDECIRSEKHYSKALNYIHYNPVKHAYTSDPYEWRWSSIHDYYETYGRDWLREEWKKNPPGDYGKGWDDL